MKNPGESGSRPPSLTCTNGCSQIATASRFRWITGTFAEKLAFAHHLDSYALPAHSIAPIGEFAHHTV
jgi:hypothetical protein